MRKNVKNGILNKMNRLVYSAAFLGLIVLSGCSYYVDGYGNPAEVVKEVQIHFEAKPDMEINFKAISGELEIRGIEGNEAVASMTVKCHYLTGECAEHFEDLEFETELRDNKLSVSPNMGLGFNKGNRLVKTVLSIPPVNNLIVKMAAGEAKISRIDVNELYVDVNAGELKIDVESVKTSLNVDLGTGDVNIMVPEDSVREVDVDVGIGEASIIRNGMGIHVPRSFLLGAQTHQFISSEGAVVWVDVNVGNIGVNLTQ
jgi:hypothetical protein